MGKMSKSKEYLLRSSFSWEESQVVDELFGSVLFKGESLGKDQEQITSAATQDSHKETDCETGNYATEGNITKSNERNVNDKEESSLSLQGITVTQPLESLLVKLNGSGYMNVYMPRLLSAHVLLYPVSFVSNQQQTSAATGKKVAVRTSPRSDRSVQTQKPECGICEEQFFDINTLKRHLRIHSGKKPYFCDICKKAFPRSCSLKRHSRIHTGKKPYCCNICNRTFTQSAALRRHLHVHSGIKPYRCSECEKKFSRKDLLVVHMRIHTGTKPYTCTLCDKAFAQKTNMKTHLLTH